MKINCGFFLTNRNQTLSEKKGILLDPLFSFYFLSYQLKYNR